MLLVHVTQSEQVLTTINRNRRFALLHPCGCSGSSSGSTSGPGVGEEAVEFQPTSLYRGSFSDADAEGEEVA